jgi:hypothetical protein
MRFVCVMIVYIFRFADSHSEAKTQRCFAASMLFSQKNAQLESSLHLRQRRIRHLFPAVLCRRNTRHKVRSRMRDRLESQPVLHKPPSDCTTAKLRRMGLGRQSIRVSCTVGHCSSAKLRRCEPIAGSARLLQALDGSTRQS